jgi:hypothetical protein
MIGALILGIVIVVVGLIIVTLLLRAAHFGFKQRKSDKANGITRFYYICHIQGLNAARGSMCGIYLNPKHLSINCGGSEFLLNLDRIRSVEYRQDSELEPYRELSPETRNQTRGYAVIYYESINGNHSGIILRDDRNIRECWELTRKLNSVIKTERTQVQL